MELKESDYKLLSYLYHNNRESITKIAKATKLTREQVDYKIKKYVDSGLIKGFLTLFDYSKFGHNYFAILLLKFEKTSSVKTFSQKLDKNKSCISYGYVYGKYDLFLNCIFKNEEELSNFISDLVSNKMNRVSDYFVIKPFFAELYPLKFFRHKDRESMTLINVLSKERKFDKKDLEILKIIAKNGRIKLIDIARKINISIELTLYKLRKLYKDKVILGSRIQFNMAEFGYHFSLILLNIRNFSEESKERIKRFSRNSKHVNSLIFSLTRPNCIVQLFHKDQRELKHTINEVKELFKDEYIDLDIMHISEDEGEIDTLPFL